jgi:hydroxyacylglutathione hydrolase
LERLAEDLYLLRGFPPYAINEYLAGDVLIDAGSRHAAGRILRQLQGHPVCAHALTHAHADHQGSSHQSCQTLDIPATAGRCDSWPSSSRRWSASVMAVRSAIANGSGASWPG